MPDPVDRIEVRNITSPTHVTRVDRAKYMAMRTALLAVLPDAAPGMTVAAAQAAFCRIWIRRCSPVAKGPDGG